ncbi:hypothetical protein B0H14DRAFT_3429708 [Mycena olivaceomarginata]|nr:hypothetical protein B0H14DRAFT_3429708 [Mycena olivaceomarginata]
MTFWTSTSTLATAQTVRSPISANLNFYYYKAGMLAVGCSSRMEGSSRHTANLPSRPPSRYVAPPKNYPDIRPPAIRATRGPISISPGPLKIGADLIVTVDLDVIQTIEEGTTADGSSRRACLLLSFLYFTVHFRLGAYQIVQTLELPKELPKRASRFPFSSLGTPSPFLLPAFPSWHARSLPPHASLFSYPHRRHRVLCYAPSLPLPIPFLCPLCPWPRSTSFSHPFLAHPTLPPSFRPSLLPPSLPTFPVFLPPSSPFTNPHRQSNTKLEEEELSPASELCDVLSG